VGVSSQAKLWEIKANKLVIIFIFSLRKNKVLKNKSLIKWESYGGEDPKQNYGLEKPKALDNRAGGLIEKWNLKVRI